MANHAPQKGFQDCPVLGVGLGLRGPLLDATLAATDLIDWVEITPENHMRRGGQDLADLQRAKAVYPVISHGVSLSIASRDPWNEAYLGALEQLFEWLDPPWFSDHLCFSSIQNIYFNDLIPLPRTRETVARCVTRIRN